MCIGLADTEAKRFTGAAIVVAGAASAGAGADDPLRDEAGFRRGGRGQNESKNRDSERYQ